MWPSICRLSGMPFWIISGIFILNMLFICLALKLHFLQQLLYAISGLLLSGNCQVILFPSCCKLMLCLIRGLDLAIYYVIAPNQGSDNIYALLICPILIHLDHFKGFGEAWTWASWIQFAGLLVCSMLLSLKRPCSSRCCYQVLFVGTAVYNGSLGTWDDGYMTLGAQDDLLEQPADGVQMKTALIMASPSLTRCYKSTCGR